MNTHDVLSARLLNQRLAGNGLEKPADVVRWLGAVQAQVYAAAKWAIGMRMAAGTDSEVEAAFHAGDIVRTHVMRPTWHFLAPEDVHWMQALTAARVRPTLGTQLREFELDAAVLKRCNTVIARALAGKQLTRAELGETLERAGIPAMGLRLANIVMNAELDALICSGPRRGKQFTYALVEERAPQQKRPSPDEALALLTERYFTGHGPATIKDYCWWSALTSAEAKRGLEMVKGKLRCEQVDGLSYWMGAAAPPAARFPRGTVYLLPEYDEYTVGYTDREALLAEEHRQRPEARSMSILNPTVISNGRVAGLWKRAIQRTGLNMEAMLFAPATKAQTRSIGLAVTRLTDFMGPSLSD